MTHHKLIVEGDDHVSNETFNKRKRKSDPSTTVANAVYMAFEHDEKTLEHDEKVVRQDLFGSKEAKAVEDTGE